MRAFALLAILASTAIGSKAQVLKVADFETGDLGQLSIQSASPESVKLVTSPVRAGRYAAQLDLRGSDPVVHHGQRAEFSDSRTPILMEKDYWYGLSLYVPKEFSTPAKADAVVFQWHTQAGGPSPVLAIRIQGDEWIVTTNATAKRRVLQRLPLQRGRWTDWVVHARWSSKPTGFWTIWQDGTEVVREKDIVTQYPEARGPYAKFGQYHSVTAGTRNTIYADEYRVAGPASKYEDVAPGKAR